MYTQLKGKCIIFSFSQSLHSSYSLGLGSSFFRLYCVKSTRSWSFRRLQSYECNSTQLKLPLIQKTSNCENSAVLAQFTGTRPLPYPPFSWSNLILHSIDDLKDILVYRMSTKTVFFYNRRQGHNYAN